MTGLCAEALPLQTLGSRRPEQARRSVWVLFVEPEAFFCYLHGAIY